MAQAVAVAVQVSKKAPFMPEPKLTREQELALAKRFDELLFASMPRHVFNGGIPPMNNDGPVYKHKPDCVSRTMGGFLCNCQCTS